MALKNHVTHQKYPDWLNFRVEYLFYSTLKILYEIGAWAE